MNKQATWNKNIECDTTCNELYWNLLRMKVENSECKKHRAHNVVLLLFSWKMKDGKKVNMTNKLSDIQH
jgi:hypothetical protein